VFGIGCDLAHISTLAKKGTTRGTGTVEATDAAEAKQGVESQVKVGFFFILVPNSPKHFPPTLVQN